MILVTRPNAAGEELCRLIDAQGGKALHFPTIAFEPIDQIATWKKQDYLIFVSPQAVRGFLRVQNRAEWIDATKIAAIGPGTKQALVKVGLHVDICPARNFSSEGLLAMPELTAVNNKRIKIIRGEGGRDYLEKTLIDRGAILTHLITYKRVIPDIDCVPFRELVRKNHIHVIVCSSFEGVNNLKIMLTETVWSQLKTVPLIVVSKRIKLLVEELGFQTIWVATDASHPSILRLLAKRGNLQWPKKI